MAAVSTKFLHTSTKALTPKATWSNCDGGGIIVGFFLDIENLFGWLNKTGGFKPMRLNLLLLRQCFHSRQFFSF
jgi:hypothetical protein